MHEEAQNLRNLAEKLDQYRSINSRMVVAKAMNVAADIIDEQDTLIDKYELMLKDAGLLDQNK